jgi:uncharacterized protein (DUF58 family)
MPSPVGNERSFLDPAIVARIGSIELIARTIVEGVLVGLHRSPFQGFSVEFSEYRQYLPGDAPSTIDWKLFARSDRYYVKKFEEETNLECHVLLDVSASMGYSSHAVSKLQYGAYLAASLAYLMHRQRDGAGLTLFDDRVVESVPIGTRAAHLRVLLATLSRAAVGKRSDVSMPLEQLAGRMKRRGLVVLISDLLDEPSAIIEGLKHLRFQGSEVLVFHTLDPAELTFPFEHAARFEDLESGDDVLTVPDQVRAHYLARMRAQIERYRSKLRLADIDYQLVDTATPLDTALLAYLATRGRRW